MAEVVLFHHAQGLTSGSPRSPTSCAAPGTPCTRPTCSTGARSAAIDEGMAFIEGIGFEDLVDRGVRAAEELPAEVVYAGFSFGVVVAQKLTQTRPGALGALLF